MRHAPKLLVLAGLAAVAFVLLLRSQQLSRGDCKATESANEASSSSNPYDILGVSKTAGHEKVVKAYRTLAKRWHPDRTGGDKAVFAMVAQAYEILTDPEKREILDRLGEDGLQRHRDGDPSVSKDWMSPEEVLRRIHNDGDEPLLQSLVTTGFATLTASFNAWQQLALPSLRWLAVSIGIDTEFPTVVITATDASGATLTSGATTSTSATFKFSLPGKSFDFEESDVAHNCARSRFLGMKTTFYLECGHAPGRTITVSVPAGAFTVMGRNGENMPSLPFWLDMV